MLNTFGSKNLPIPYNNESDPEGGSGTQTLTRPKNKTKKPSMYKVLLLNDDFTPMDFVIHVLQKFFKKSFAEANKVMLQVHHEGAGVAGVYSYELAETKVYLVNDYSRKNKHPLKCIMEEVPENEGAQN